MKHWLKRALATAALASGAMIATAGMASASSESPLPVDPEAIISLTQEATNNNATNQNAQPNVETHQSNVYVPVAVLSKDSNNGKVEQSNEAETTAIAVNENGTKQSIDQDQTAEGRDGCGKCGSEGGSSQSQTAENNNTTNQNAQPNAETHQSNQIGSDQAEASNPTWDKGYESPRDRDGAEQSNEAETTAIAVNENGTKQSIDQDQTAEGRDGCGKCDSEGGSSQSQTAENNNTTNQNAQPNAETHQSNVYVPVAVLSKDSNNGKVEQSNEAETTAIAVNENGTKQSIDQDQTAEGRDGCGKCGSEGGSSQSQTAENNNTTNQNAQPNAETHQSNQIGSDQAEASNPTWDKGYESPRDRDGAEQSNEAETTAIAVNENGTKQSIDQDQTAGGTTRTRTTATTRTRTTATTRTRTTATTRTRTTATTRTRTTATTRRAAPDALRRMDAPSHKPLGTTTPPTRTPGPGLRPISPPRPIAVRRTSISPTKPGPRR